MDVEVGSHGDPRFGDAPLEGTAQPVADAEGSQTAERGVNGLTGLRRIRHVHIAEQQRYTLQEPLDISALDPLEPVLVALVDVDLVPPRLRALAQVSVAAGSGIVLVLEPWFRGNEEITMVPFQMFDQRCCAQP